MTNLYDVFMKHAAHVLKRENIKPEISGVKHFENGDAVVTDAFRLYQAKGVHDRKDGAILTPASRKVDVEYPNVSRIIPENPKQRVSLETEELLCVADMICSVGKLSKSPIVLMEFTGNTVQYRSLEVQFQHELPVTFETPASLDATFMLDAMKMFKDAGCKTITLNFFGSLRPMTLVNEDESLLALILPVRKR